jgi:hypothetical protein
VEFLRSNYPEFLPSRYPLHPHSRLCIHFNLETIFSLRGRAVTPCVMETLIKVINK